MVNINVAFCPPCGDVFIYHIKDYMKNYPYFCYECKKKLIPVKGEKNIHSFRHEVGSSCQGRKEGQVKKRSKKSKKRK